MLERFDEGAMHHLNPELSVADQAELLPYDQKWEFPRKLLKLVIYEFITLLSCNNAMNVIHGYLAARNILLTDNNVVKICDFGLARTLYGDKYTMKGECPLPVKWLPVESIKERVFSVQSDVWSFGIVMWELFTLGKTPYPGVRAEDLCERLVSGLRTEKPKYAPEHVYRMMLHCWREEPSERPCFPNLSDGLNDFLEEDVKTEYFELNAGNEERDYLTMDLSPEEPVPDSSRHGLAGPSNAQSDEAPNSVHVDQ